MNKIKILFNMLLIPKSPANKGSFPMKYTTQTALHHYQTTAVSNSAHYSLTS